MFHNPDLKIDIPKIPNAPAAMPACAGAVVGRRPRIAIMGEFSAGKSTLTNMLIGSNALPVKVTATQLPPVWLSYGSAPPFGVDLGENRFGVDFDRPGQIPLTETLYLRVQNEASVLELCDIIDFPGISDPNMPPEVWQRTVSLADAVIWCTHAVQAWRQSEAAAWEEMPAALRARSFLLLTRIDKVTEERDRRRVLARVRRETEGRFAHVFPVSLTRALAAGDDRAAWEASGAEDVMSALLDLVMSLSGDAGPTALKPGALLAESRADASFDRLKAAAEGAAAGISGATRDPFVAEATTLPSAPVNRIVPRRVSVNGTVRRHARPTGPSADQAAIFRMS